MKTYDFMWIMLIFSSIGTDGEIIERLFYRCDQQFSVDFFAVALIEFARNFIALKNNVQFSGEKNTFKSIQWNYLKARAEGREKRRKKLVGKSTIWIDQTKRKQYDTFTAQAFGI